MGADVVYGHTVLACAVMSDADDSSIAFRQALGHILLATRQRKRMSRDQVVAASGLGQATVFRCEGGDPGRGGPTLETYVNICQGLRVSPTDVLTTALERAGCHPRTSIAREITLERFVALCNALGLAPSAALTTVLTATAKRGLN